MNKGLGGRGQGQLDAAAVLDNCTYMTLFLKQHNGRKFMRCELRRMSGPRPGSADQTNAKVAPGGHHILVNPTQRSNVAVLKALRSVPWKFSDIQPDFVLTPHVWAVFVSLRTHALHGGALAKAVHAIRRSGFCACVHLYVHACICMCWCVGVSGCVRLCVCKHNINRAT